MGMTWCLRVKHFLLAGRIGCVCIRFKKFSNFAKLGLQREFILLGPVPIPCLAHLDGLDTSMVVYTHQTVDALIQLGIKVRIHLKVETGNNRQGVDGATCLALARKIRDSEHLELEGICTHFSDIEDTTDHGFARSQINRFEQTVELLLDDGINIPIRHVSNTAATLLWSDLPYELVRVGIGAYGLWPK